MSSNEPDQIDHPTIIFNENMIMPIRILLDLEFSSR